MNGIVVCENINECRTRAIKYMLISSTPFYFFLTQLSSIFLLKYHVVVAAEWKMMVGFS
jgi:hypothetical protein